MTRVVESEILDHLPADDPAAIRSRAELRMINARSRKTLEDKRKSK